MKYSISKRPNPINKDEAPKYYATPIWEGQCSIETLTDEISLATSLTPADVRACIYAFLQAIPQHLMAGQAVNLEGFGIFRLSFSVSGGHEDAKKVSAADIETLRVLFRACAKLKECLEKTPFTAERRAMELLKTRETASASGE